MKRKITALIIMVLAAMLAFSACGGLGKVNVVGKQDPDYIVLSNGGSAVMFGNYVYSLNGYRGYEDADGKSNLFGKIEKGAIYRSELEGTPQQRLFNFSFGDVTKRTYDVSRNAASGKALVTTEKSVLTGYEKNDSGEYLKIDDKYVEIRETEYQTKSQLIAPKTVGTTGFDQGGIFIFDDYIFYASPSNKKDRSGDVLTHRTEFYRGKLDGSKTELIFTTENDATSSSYMFYKYNGAYYLVVQDGTEVKSVKMDNKIRSAVTIAKDVTAVHFPNKEMYYAGMPENTAMDFIYFLRTPTKDDISTLGNILEMCRPDGSNGSIISSKVTATIRDTSNGVFFYEVGSVIHYSNFADITGAETAVSGKLTGIDLSTYTYTKLIAPVKSPNDIRILASSSSGTVLITRAGNADIVMAEPSQLVSVVGSKAYLTATIDGENVLVQAELYAENNVEVIMTTDNVSSLPTYKYDILPDFVVYFADIDESAKNYTFFHELSDASADPQFVGYRIASETTDESDLYPDED